jgi:hypothetical protein
MADEWNTVNIKPGKGGVVRDIDLLRKRYSDHRSMLERLAADAPSEHMARRYRDLVAEVDAAVAKLDALESEPESAVPVAAPVRDARGARSWSDAPPYARADDDPPKPRRASTGARTLLILIAGLFMIGILALLFWSWLNADEPETPIVRPETTLTETTAPAVPEPEPETDLAVDPETHDYGTIRRGARAARQFEIQNQTDATLGIQVERSACRCLWFEYADTIPARGTTTLTVTVDAAKVPPGPLSETVEVTTKTDPPASTTFTVKANVTNGAAAN